MLKVLKFGGSSMADAHQFAKVKAIVDSDPSRRVVVVSAAGKRSRDDHKLTDLLYLCYAHLQYGVSCDAVFDMIRSRYLSIRDELHLSTPLEAEFAALREKMDRGISQDELVSGASTSPPASWRTIWATIFWTASAGSASGWTAPWISPPATRPCAAPPPAAGW